MEKNNEGFTELSMEQMDQVSGGVYRTVNTGVADLKAAVRKGPSKKSGQIASLANGTVVDTIGDPVYDEVSGRHFVEVTFTDKKGVQRTGWIDSSILGMKR